MAVNQVRSPSYGTLDDHDSSSSKHDGVVVSDRSPTSDEEQIASDDDIEAGVQKIEAISRTWTERSLLVAYLGVFLISFCVSLENQTVASLSAYATSSFRKHSMVSTVLVIQGILNAVIKAPMAKIADTFGRLEAFTFCILLLVAGYIQLASSQTIAVYAAAQLCYATGSTGIQILAQVFIADTSSLLNRALLSRIPDLPFFVTVWIGPWLAATILRTVGWRWGYGAWAILLPAAFTPFAISLIRNARRVKRFNLNQSSVHNQRQSGLLKRLQRAWFDLDVFGLILFSAGLTLILVPLTLIADAENGWRNTRILSMLGCGWVLLGLLPFWESSKRLAPHPLLSLALFRERTVVAGCAIAFFFFAAFFFSVQPYLYSYLQVVHHLPIVTAGRITQTFGFTATCSALGASLIIRRTRQYRPFIILGALLYLSGLGSMLFLLDTLPTPAILATQIVLGLGGGLINVSVQLAVQASTSHAHVAAATALFLTALELGGAVGSAGAGAIWTQMLPRKLRVYLPPQLSDEDVREIFGQLGRALAEPVGSAARDGIEQAYRETFGTLLRLAIGLATPLLPLAVVVRSKMLE